MRSSDTSPRVRMIAHTSCGSQPIDGLVGLVEDVRLTGIELARDALYDPIAGRRLHSSLQRLDERRPTRPCKTTRNGGAEVVDLVLIMPRELDCLDHDRPLAKKAHSFSAPE